jgi:hypothetical protein
MTGYLNLTPFERLLKHHHITVNEVSLAIFSINPNTKNQDIPKRFEDEIKDVRKAMIRNIRAVAEKYTTTNSDLPSDLVFGAAFQFINQEITPESIIKRATEAIENLAYTNSWESTIYCLGGRQLVEECRLLRKSGRGRHRKDDERKNTEKLLGLLISLLAEKHPNGKYGSADSPSIGEIYADIIKLADTRKINITGVGKSTFYEKIRRSLVVLIDD